MFKSSINERCLFRTNGKHSVINFVNNRMFPIRIYAVILDFYFCLVYMKKFI